MIMLTVIYDNHGFVPGLETDWGFACLIETPDTTILFDTGADGAILLRNMARLGLSTNKIQSVVLSHNHTDHTGGLAAVLRANSSLQMYVLPSAKLNIPADVSHDIKRTVIAERCKIAEGVWTTGPFGAVVPEQSLILHGTAGQVIVTGCAHPGIVAIVSREREHSRISTVIGGFHLKDMTAGKSEAVIADLEALGVRYAAPCHCTGDTVMAQFQRAFGERFTTTGAGSQFQIA